MPRERGEPEENPCGDGGAARPPEEREESAQEEHGSRDERVAPVGRSVAERGEETRERSRALAPREPRRDRLHEDETDRREPDEHEAREEHRAWEDSEERGVEERRERRVERRVVAVGDLAREHALRADERQELVEGVRRRVEDADPYHEESDEQDREGSLHRAELTGARSLDTGAPPRRDFSQGFTPKW